MIIITNDKNKYILFLNIFYLSFNYLFIVIDIA